MLSWGVWWHRYRQIALMILMWPSSQVVLRTFLDVYKMETLKFSEVELARISHFLRPSGELNGVQRGFLFRYEFQEMTTLQAYNST
ncbi:hypothetical protein CDAR_65281 [Caerostris darwini]|uniref:Uncharacterized protein n=1 Tax=Caerostris darwini TaxID=1538125 RepID=A0AAV4PW27_9ARAC|nr:hypothetical protein CDAR_65281 [Caerostris darwini]